MNQQKLPDAGVRTEIGHSYPAEYKDALDAETGRKLKQWTSSSADNYPLYYFIPSITKDGKFMIFHSERTGWVQLYRLSFETGEIVQLTAGRTSNSGWAMWCEEHVRGIYNHLSALNGISNEVFYFQDDEVRSTHILTLRNRKVCSLPQGEVPVGQTDISPDGNWFAIIHTNGENLAQVLSERRIHMFS